MNLDVKSILLTALALLLMAGRACAAETNGTGAVTRDEMAANFLQIQEQLHATQIAIEQNQEAALEASQSNAIVLAQKLQSLEQTVQRVGDADTARKNQQLTFLIAGAFGFVGLLVLVSLVYFQWRAFTQLAQISSQQHLAVANTDAVHQLAAPGRATVEASTAQLLGVVSRLEQRINELESGQKLLPEIGTVKSAGMLTEGQKYLDGNQPVKALECFDKFLAGQPNHAEAMVKHAETLEKMGRDDEALAGYNRAIAVDSSLVIAHLRKGGLLNRLRRYDEALNCYEQALLGQEKKAKA